MAKKKEKPLDVVNQKSEVKTDGRVSVRLLRKAFPYKDGIARPAGAVVKVSPELAKDWAAKGIAKHV